MKHIYIVEDDQAILESLTFLLEDKYKITGIDDGNIALQQIATDRPELVLLDLLMPKLDGARFIEELAKKNINIPILVMSASSNIEAKLKGLNVAGMINKPFEIEEIEAMIARLIGT